VSALHLYRNGHLQASLTHAPEEAKPVYPTQEELLALRKKAGRLDFGSSIIRGQVKMVHAGVEGELVRIADGAGQVYAKTSFGDFGLMEQAFGDTFSWAESTLQPFEELQGNFRKQVQLMDALTMPGDWSSLFDSIAVTGISQRDGREVYAVEMRSGDFPVVEGFIDSKTGDLLRFRLTMELHGMGITYKTVVHNQDFRKTNGVRFAHRIVSSEDFTGRVIIEIDSFKTQIEVAPGQFDHP